LSKAFHLSLRVIERTLAFINAIIFFSALLAANPSLANAAPGSYVIVASPSSVSNPASQLLQVYVVGGPAPTSNPAGEGPAVPVVASQVPEKHPTENTLDMSAAGRVRTFSGTLHHQS